MKLIRISTLLVFLCAAVQLWAWGQTGHRVVGYVAQQHLSAKASKRVNQVLTKFSLEMSGNYMDFLRSDTNYRFMNSWHYVSIPDGMRYEDIIPNPKCDVISIIEQLIVELRTKQFKLVKDEEFAIMALVHLVGDLHQPLHVGLAEDKGGNDIQVRWFNDGTNLHRVWDSDMINHFNMTYTELAENTDKISKEQVKFLQKGAIMDWANETQQLAIKVYSSAEVGEKLGYNYAYNNFELVRSQLQVGGVRLAKVLNDLFS